MPLAKDIWRPLIVEAPIETVLRAGSIEGFAHRWLPKEDFLCFLADPFGIERNGMRYVFVERYDYRSRRGTIECLAFASDGSLSDRRQVLEEPWHLSYPFVFETAGETYMLPEAHRSGGLTLYRAVEFPWRWERTAVIALDHVAIDATPVFHEGLWWLFYSTADHGAAGKTGALFLAWADRIEGPWTPHTGNPVRRGEDASRPGGTPAVMDGKLVLPMQDCRRTYGAAIRPLSIHRLAPDVFEAEAGAAITAPHGFAPFDAGLHTLSAIGSATLVDVKRKLLTPRSLVVLTKRELAKR
ncbi:formyl transferase [Sphingomonas sp. CGMCC 1.13654]|uniref:Formyl transferase n=1 Tax=Sphingomonas chungangi TaxID=2683589 RepID=A0A838L8Q9_9SPHN|nr:formyl transferase [Sphingomonas chungangi]MBA2935574.1 formyl transferase [Sphingomonas chungangi]MVW54266.1 formyl transferase [Sphingomonas chungangi]